MRTILTEDESLKFSKEKDQFLEKLARATAELIAQFPPAIEEEIVSRLSELTSLYSPFTFDLIRAYARQLRAQYPT